MPETIFNTICSLHNIINNANPKYNPQDSREEIQTKHERRERCTLISGLTSHPPENCENLYKSEKGKEKKKRYANSQPGLAYC